MRFTTPAPIQAPSAAEDMVAISKTGSITITLTMISISSIAAVLRPILRVPGISSSASLF